MTGHRIARFPSAPPRHTLADIRRFAGPDRRVAVRADDTTPDGYFYAVADVFGDICTYLLRGQPGDDDAQVVGVIVRGFAYHGYRLVGGRHLNGGFVSDADAFRLIIGAETLEARRG